MTVTTFEERAAPPWPGAAGGGWSPAWGDAIRLFAQAQIEAGRNWHMGPHAQDRLDAGNVVGHVTESVGGTSLWVDLACWATRLEIVDGATTSAGILARDEAATLTLELYDPERRFDPLNPDSPYWYGTSSRLHAATPIQVFAEVLDTAGTGVVRFLLFAGTTDSWATPIRRDPGDRRTTITATGAVKAIANKNYAEGPPVGDGDTTAQRLDRIRTYFALRGTLEQIGPASSVTLLPTTLAQSAWEHINRTLDDELGFVHVLPDGTIRWWTRRFWNEPLPAPSVTIGCGTSVFAYDIGTEAPILSSEDQLRNAVYAARVGGTQQVVRSDASILAHGGIETSVTRTDLGLRDDGQVSTWANLLVSLFAFPHTSIGAVALLPGLGYPVAARWRQILGVRIVTDTVRVVWTPDDATPPVDKTMRVSGFRHTVTPDSWELQWSLFPATVGVQNVWHIGPHTNAKLDSGNVMGWTH